MATDKFTFTKFRDSLGRKQGLFKIYYDNGQQCQIAYNKDGKLDRQSRSFFDIGQSWDIREYKLSKSVGTRIEILKSRGHSKGLRDTENGSQQSVYVIVLSISVYYFINTTS
jgi:hypothetical protein